MDQPIMSLSDIDLSPGFVTQLSVTPTLHETTDQGKDKNKKTALFLQYDKRIMTVTHN